MLKNIPNNDGGHRTNLNNALSNESSSNKTKGNSGKLIGETFTDRETFNCGWVGSLITDDAYALLLATAIVQVLSTNDEPNARTLLDNGSQYNFITAKLAKRLDPPLIKVSKCIKGMLSLCCFSLTCSHWTYEKT